DDAELLELLERALDRELREARLARQLFAAELAVDARQHEAVHGIQLELADVDVRNDPRDLLRHGRSKEHSDFCFDARAKNVSRPISRASTPILRASRGC